MLTERGVGGGLLRSVDRHGRVGEAITCEGINLNRAARALAADVSGVETCSAHSLRDGVAAVAYAGVSVSSIVWCGRWSENSPVVVGYIRDVDRLQTNARCGVGL